MARTALYWILVIALSSVVTANLGASADEDEIEAGLRDAVCSEHPSQVHLSLAGGPERMAVSWSNRCVRYTEGAILGGSDLVVPWHQMAATGYAVEVWEESRGASSARTVPATTRRYFLSYHHSCVLDGLSAATRYCYAVQGHASAGGCFRTAEPAVDAPFTFAILGDMGTRNSLATVAGLSRRAHELAFIMHSGDVGYADDLSMGSPWAYESVFDYFMVLIESVARFVPYQTCVGNHDVSCDILSDLSCAPGQRNFAAYRSRFRMPSRESGAGDHGMWYSFRRGNAHFAVIDTESDYPDAATTPSTRVGGGRGGGFGDQLAWLERDLSTARADPNVSWLIVVGHRPAYASKRTEWPPNSQEHVRSAFEPLFARHGVDLYLAGHVHFYERLRPLLAHRACTPAERCTTHITNGAAGQPEGLNHEGSRSTTRLVERGVYNKTGFCVVNVSRDRLYLRYIASKPGDLDEEVADEFELNLRQPALSLDS
jgi:hypothetical protein